MSDSEIGSFLEKQSRAGEHESAGSFTLDGARAGRLLVEQSLEEPALAVLWAVQAAVAAGATKIRLDVTRSLLSLRLGKPNLEEVPLRSPEFYLGREEAVSHGSLALALWAWHYQGLRKAECRWFTAGALWTDITACFTQPVGLPPRPEGLADLAFRLHRRASKTQVAREIDLLRERCRFCPIQIFLNDEVVQSRNFAARSRAKSSLLPAEFHLGEYYRGGGGPAGLAIFRSDWTTSLKPGQSWVDSDRTLQREVSGGALTQLRWVFPERIAGMTTRMTAHTGVLCQAAAFLLPDRALATLCTPVNWGVSCKSFAWEGPPGVHLVLDVSGAKTDLSGLTLVEDTQLLPDWHVHLRRWTELVSRGMMSRLKVGNAFSWQTRREIKLVMGIFGATVITGAATFLPLPFLGLPWAMWYYGSRKKALESLRQRCLELARPGPGDGEGVKGAGKKAN